jgi:ribokinase
MKRKRILVVGSSNLDFILRIRRFPQTGETIAAKDLITAFGGKGANQAIAARRMGATVTLLTKLGNDAFGQSYRKYFIRNGLNGDWILRDAKRPTGAAVIEVTPHGENRIVVSPGANHSISAKDLKELSDLWKTVVVFVTQMEIPSKIVAAALRLAKANGALTLFNPSPPSPLPPDVFRWVDFILLNGSEAEALTGVRVKGVQLMRRAAKDLLNRGAHNVVITLGKKGLFFKGTSQEISMGGFRIHAVDTTAAGDAFMGAFAWKLSEGSAIRDALRFASAAGALAATKLGAQPSLPLKREVELFLRRAPKSVHPRE